MLKMLDPLLCGSLLAILADMGHGEEIVLADANFPSAGLARRLVELPGTSVTDVLDAVLTLFPLDDFVDKPVAVMAAPADAAPMYDGFQRAVDAAEGRSIGIEPIDRFAFYDRAKLAYAVVATGERRLYGNLILKKGVVRL